MADRVGVGGEQVRGWSTSGQQGELRAGFRRTLLPWASPFPSLGLRLPLSEEKAEISGLPSDLTNVGGHQRVADRWFDPLPLKYSLRRKEIYLFSFLQFDRLP